MNDADPNLAATQRAVPQPVSSQSWQLTLLLDEQSIDWQRGARPAVETYLARRTGLRDDTETILHLIYHEVLLRRRLGCDEPTVEEYIARFPHLEHELTIQFELDQALPFDQADAASPRPEHVPVPVHVPGYEVLEVLGRGGMGIVYRARQESLNRTVALKMILDGVHAGTRQANRFRSEAALFARLQHPNIVQIHEIGEHDGRPFLALEYVPGGTLERELAGTPLHIDRAASLLETLARAVQHAHDRGVVHRDLKPANVLLSAEREPKITDFGLAKLLAGDSRQTVSGALVGTPSYMAPEQVDSAPAIIGPMTDIYALGAILYETLTGRPPFRGESPMATMLQVRGSIVVPPRQFRPGLSRDLETICLKCLDKDPRRRYQTAAALADDLARFRDGRPIVARPVPAWERAWLWARREKALATGLLVSIAALLLLMAGGVYHDIKLRHLNSRLATSNIELESARRNAEQNAREALAAITQMLVRVADQQLSGVPEAEPVRRALLSDALKQLELLRKRNTGDPEIRHEIGRVHLGIAAIHKALGEFAQAAAQCREAISELDPLLAEHPDNVLYQDTVAGAHLALAELVDPEQGKEHFLRAVALWEPLAAENHVIRGKLAGAFFAVASEKHGFGLAPAASYLEKAIGLLEGLVRDQPLPYNHALARAIYNLGLAEAEKGNEQAALKHYRRSLKIWDSLPASERGELDQQGIAACQNALGLLLPGANPDGGLAEARDMLRQAVETCEQLAKRHPRLVEHRAALSRAWSNLGSVDWGQKRYAEAEPSYEQALKVNEASTRDFPETRDLRIRLAHCYQNLADTRAKLGKTREARQGFEQALAVISPLMADGQQEYAVLECMGTICLNYANLARLDSGPAAALPLQERSVRAFEAAHRVAPLNADARRVLKGARTNLYKTLIDLNRQAEAAAVAEAMLPLCDSHDLLATRLMLGLSLARTNRHEQAVAQARELASESGLDGETCYNTACIFSLSVAAARTDFHLDSGQKNVLVKAYASEAIALLKRAGLDATFPRKELLETLEKDPDMDSIRSSEEFKKLVERLQK